MTDFSRWRLRHEAIPGEFPYSVVVWCTAPDGSPRVAIRAEPYDEQIAVWDTEAGTREADLIARDRQLWLEGASACFTTGDNGEVMAIAEHSILGLWDRTTGRPLTILGEHPDGINAMAVLPGPRLVTCGDDSQVLIWDLTPGDPVALAGHREEVEAAAVFTHDGVTRLATGGYDGLVIIWDLATGTEVRRFDLGNFVLSLAVLPRENRVWLLAGCHNTGIHRLDPDTGEVPWQAERSDEVEHVVVGTDPSGQSRVVGAGLGDVLIWDPDQPELEFTIPMPDSLTYPVSYRRGVLTLRTPNGWQCLELVPEDLVDGGGGEPDGDRDLIADSHPRL